MPLTLQVVSDHAEELGERARMVFGEAGGTIGRARGNDWVLGDPDRTISARHAAISFDGGQYYLTDTSTNGVFVNDGDAPVGQGNRLGLQTGDRLAIGPYEISVDTGLASTDAVSPERTGPEDRTIFSIAGGPGAVDPTAAFWQGVGVAPSEAPPEATAALMHQVGLAVRYAVAAMMELLRGRTEFKSELRAPVTVMRASGNNPLKFSATAEEALRWLLVEREAGYLALRESFREALEDIREHELAVTAAMHSAVEAISLRFDSAQASGQDADGLQAAFREEFARAYEGEVQHLATARKDR